MELPHRIGLDILLFFFPAWLGLSTSGKFYIQYMHCPSVVRWHPANLFKSSSPSHLMRKETDRKRTNEDTSNRSSPGCINFTNIFSHLYRHGFTNCLAPKAVNPSFPGIFRSSTIFDDNSGKCILRVSSSYPELSCSSSPMQLRLFEVYFI